MSEFTVTPENVAQVLQNDTMVKVAGVDVDGQLRGKLMAKQKFLSVVSDGFGFCSVVFGWDMHDQTYFKELSVSNKENGYRDIVAVPDLSSFRRIPWEGEVPFFLVSFFDPETKEPVCACPRGLLKTVLGKAEAVGFRAMAGGEYQSPTTNTGNRLYLTMAWQPNTSSISIAHQETMLLPSATPRQQLPF